MRHERDKIYRDALKAVEEHSLIWVEEVVTFLPICKTTFYSLFPAGSDELNDIKNALDSQKVQRKIELRKKFYDSNNPTLMLALYKLCANEQERQALSMNEPKTAPEAEEPDYDLELLSDEEQETWIRLYDKATGKEVTENIDYEEVSHG